MYTPNMCHLATGFIKDNIELSVMATASRGGRDRRGQSAPIAVILILGIVVVGTSVAIVAAAGVIGDGQRQLDADRAEQTLSQLDSKVSLVGLGEAHVQRVSLASVKDGAYELRSDAGWMNVTVRNVTDGSTRTMFNATMGAVVFENDDRSVAYQGGGVWQGDRDGAVMVSPPEFHYRQATLTLPLVTVDGDRSLSGPVNLEPNGSTVQHFPNTSKDSDWENPLEHGVVNVSVKSEYYRGWGSFWEQRTDGDVSYDHDERIATVQLTVPAGNRNMASAIASTSATGELTLSGAGGNPARTDSYNSSNGDYASTKTNDGHIVTAGDVTLSGNSEVNGTVESGGFVDLDSANSIVRGDLLYTDGKDVHTNADVTGTTKQISDTAEITHIDGYVTRQYENLSEDNDNGDAGVPISGNTLDSGDQTLGPGQYHVNEIDLRGDQLTLDTGAGETIQIGVRDNVFLDDGAEIRVEGTGQVRVFVDGQDTGPNGNHFGVDHSGSGGSDVNVTDDENASQFWLYGQQDFRAHIEGTNSDDFRFEGVIYAPGGLSGSSSLEVDHADVFGGVVSGEVTVDTGGSIHFDESLQNERVLPPDESIVRLTYMHVTRSRVNVTG
jgi:hypothetical protein